jgi:uncharacterized membrane protein YtjA (UPF0391 family)
MRWCPCFIMLCFLVIALIAALFGFGGIAAGAAGIAKVLFVVFLIGAVVAFLMNGRGSRIWKKTTSGRTAFVADARVPTFRVTVGPDEWPRISQFFPAYRFLS